MIFSKRAIVNLMLIFTLFMSCRNSQEDNTVWQTFYEQSGKIETPHYEQTMDFFKRLDAVSPIAKMIRFGISPEGRDLNLFIISKNRFFTPEQANKSGKPIVLIQCCIHPGESEGKDAAMMLARDILIHQIYPEILDKLVITIIPIFNVDGHERFGPYNRINQNGPNEMGWRVTSTRLNLNRDFIKADAPEMHVWLKMFNQWKPHLFYDCHTTDGQDFQYVLTYKIDTHEDYGGAVSQWAKNEFLPAIIPACEAKGHIIGPFAGLIDEQHPEKGLMGGVWRPMLSNSYVTVRNRAGLLIETHSLKPYSQRVQATYDFILVGLQKIAEHPNQILKAVKLEDDRTSNLGKTYISDDRYALQYRSRTDNGDSLLYRGYSFEMKKGNISGDDFPVYSNEPWDVPSVLFEEVEPAVSVTPPLGYLIPRQWIDVIDIIRLHGVKTYPLKEDVTNEFECYRFRNVKFRSFPYEGRHLASYETNRTIEQRTFKASSVYVPLGCPESKIIMQMLEPEAPDALIGWGFFNTIFEMREYFEPYVMEPMAQQMAEQNPKLSKAFNDKLKSDSDFSADSYQRLLFFYERLPYWDHEKNLYPVARVTKPLDPDIW